MSHSEYDPDPRNGCSGLWVKCEAAGGAGLARSLCQEGEREGGEVVCEMAAVSTHILCTPAVLPWKHQLLEAWIMCVCGTVRAWSVKNLHCITDAQAWLGLIWGGGTALKGEEPLGNSTRRRRSPFDQRTAHWATLYCADSSSSIHPVWTYTLLHLRYQLSPL